MMKRLFIAIKIQPEMALFSAVGKMKSALASSRITWVDLSIFHLTFKFLGETDERLVPQLVKIVEEVSAENCPFEVSLSGMGLFGSSYDPKVVWVGFEENKTIQNVYSQLNEKLKTLDIYADRQNFVPHLTLGRIKGQVDKRRLSELVSSNRETFFQKSSIQKVSLYESILRPNGPLYIELK